MEGRLIFKKGKQRELLKVALSNLKIKRNDFAQLFGVPFKTFEKWLYEERTIPKSFWNRLILKIPKLRSFEKFIIREEDINWGCRKGGKTNINQITNLANYMRKRHESLRKKARRIKHFYLKNLKITSPIGKRVKKLKLDPLPLIGIMLLTDGHVCKKKKCWEVGYNSKDRQLIKLFMELVSIWKGEIVVSIYKRRNGMMQAYFHLPIKNEILKLTPTFKKSPQGENIKDYLSSPQPSLNFLKNLSKEYKLLAIRLALSAEGGIALRGKYPKPKYRLFLSCANPNLAKDWHEILSSLEFKFKISNDKSKWSGISGLHTNDQTQFLIFYLIGGFVEGVKISRKSKNFYNMEKNKLLSRIIRSYPSLPPFSK